MKILIVDDSDSMRFVLKAQLRKLGYTGNQVREATNGNEAMNLIKKDPPDLILADWVMPEMTGIELLEELKRGHDEIKFGFITAIGTPANLERAMNSGADFFISKPYRIETLAKNLETLGGSN